VRRLAVDATGLGGPIADLLTARLGRSTVEAVTFTAERKSRLGFGLLAAVHSGRLRLYRMDGSLQWAECRRQLEVARAVYREQRLMQFHVDPNEGHDDYVMSLALAVWAARLEGGERAARGRVPEPAQAERMSA
jgi:phage FluMu gp28-like protein